MTEEERAERLNKLYIEQEAMFSGNICLEEYLSESLPLKSLSLDTSNIIIPVFQDIQSMEKIDDDIFANWQIADIPVLVVAGGLGTLSSVLLRDFFANIHDDLGKTPTLDGGHSGENTDWVPGAKQPGGLGHRWNFGHDLLNPFEVDWEQYIEIGAKSGATIPAWLKAPFYWIKHLLQDTFSKEGLPMPGNSLLRDFLNPADPKTREILQFLGTIKARDVAGAGITNLIMGAYVWGTEKDLKKVVCKPNYRGYSLMLGANLVTLLSGLLVPPPLTSFNWGTIPVICYYSYHLIQLEKAIRGQLKRRDNILDMNQKALMNNEYLLENVTLMNDKYYEEFMIYENDIDVFYNSTLAKHEFLKKTILIEGV